LIVSPH